MSNCRGFFAYGPKEKAKLFLLILSFLIGSFFIFPKEVKASAAWYDQNWQFRKAIIVDHTKVGSGAEDETDFPILVSLTGLNQDHINANGTDIRFTLNDGTTELAREIESYLNGTLKAWVKIPALSHTADTVIYMYYGNAGVAEPAAGSDYGSQKVWTNNYAAVWHLKETGANPQVFDSTANGNNSDFQNFTSTSSGQIGNAAVFSGGSITFPNSASLTPDHLTISAWEKTTGGGSNRRIISKAWIDNDWPYPYSQYEIFLQNGNKPYFAGAVNGNAYATENSNTIDSNWHYIVGSYDGTLGRVFADGIQQQTFNQVGTLSHDNATHLSLGNRTGSAGDEFYGTIDEVRVSTDDRTTGWISTEYNNQNSPNTFYSTGSEEGYDPIGYWKMDDNGNDSSGNGLNLTFSNPAPPYNSSHASTTYANSKSMGFSGGTTYAAANSDKFIYGTTRPISESFWIKTSTKAAVSQEWIMALTDTGNQSAGYGNGVYIDTSGYLHYYNWSGGVITVNATDKNYADGNWHHIGTTYDGSYMRLYIDGVQKGGDVAYSLANSGTPYAVFSYSHTNLESYTGLLDDVRIYSRALTSDEIVKLASGVDINDSTAPTVSTLTPADNATGVAVDSNLVIKFSENVYVESGNIKLYKSDNTLIETFALPSAKVTGTGTDTITINPTDDLEEGTSYYIKIDAAAFDDPNGNSYAGISDTATWNFTSISSLIAHWKFDNSMNDSSSNGNNFTAFNTSYSDDIPETDLVNTKSLLFDSNDYAVSGPSDVFNNLSGTQAFTQSLWIKTTTKPSAGNTSYIVMMTGEGQDSGLHDKGIFIDPSGHVNFYAWSGATEYIYTDKDVTDGVWHQVIATYDGSNMKLYVDGVQYGGDVALSSSYSDNYVVLSFQMSSDPTFQPYAGQLDDFRIYNRALTADEISHLSPVQLPSLTGTPAFTAGTPAKFGAQLTVGAGTLNPSTNLTYTWYRSANNSFDGGDTQLTTGNTYTPVSADIGKYLIVKASSVDADGTASVATASVVINSGSSVSTNTNDGNATLVAPDGFSDKNLTLHITKIDSSSAPASNSGIFMAGDNYFSLTATDESDNPVTTFNQPITFTISYGSDTESKYLESTLDVYKNDNGTWVKKNCALDISANTLTCSLSSFSDYGVLGEEIASDSDTVSSSTHHEKVDLKIFNVKYEAASPNEIKISWHTNNNADEKVYYGTDKNLGEKKSNEQKSHQHVMHLTDLKTGQKYYFRASSADNENQSARSEIYSLTLADENQENSVGLSADATVSAYSGSAEPNVCAYTVQQGDTLWSIAKAVYGDATAYSLIIDSNKEKYPDIENKLSIGQELNFSDCNGVSGVKGASDEKEVPGSTASNDPTSSNSDIKKPEVHWWNPFSWF